MLHAVCTYTDLFAALDFLQNEPLLLVSDELVGIVSAPHGSKH